MKKRASQMTGRDAHFFGVGPHRICLLLYKEIPVNPRRFRKYHYLHDTNERLIWIDYG